jgi:hypothetical protein
VSDDEDLGMLDEERLEELRLAKLKQSEMNDKLESEKKQDNRFDYLNVVKPLKPVASK